MIENSRLRFIGVTLALCLTGVLVTSAQEWQQFRGPGARGVSDNPKLPLTWDLETNKNIQWKVPTVGRGWSSPVVTGGKIFYTAVANEGETEAAKKGLYFGGDRNRPPTGVHHWNVVCRDLQTGKLIWLREVHKGNPTAPVHIKNSFASSTPVTDGKYLYVSFGHQGTYCFDLAGKTVWSQDGVAAKMRNDWGTAASPVLHGDRLIIVDDNEQQSRLQMLDKTTGNLIWEVKRDENSNWSTPFVWENSLRTEIIVPGTGANRAYDLQGELLYQFSGNSSITIATAYAENDLLYVSSGYVLDSRKPLFAIRPGATGDITLKADQTSNDHIVWCQKNAAPYNPSSLLYQGRIYVLYDRGFIACFAARTGKEIYSRQRINGGRGFTSSPWAYRGHVFCLNEDGETFVLKAGDQYELVGRNRLGEEEMAMATPALAGEHLLVRTADYLYSIGLSPIGQK